MFYILLLGTVIRLLTKNEIGMTGSLENVYESIQKLDDIYYTTQPNKSKGILLNPRVLVPSFSHNFPLLRLHNYDGTDNEFLKLCVLKVSSSSSSEEKDDCNNNERVCERDGEIYGDG